VSQSCRSEAPWVPHPSGDQGQSDRHSPLSLPENPRTSSPLCARLRLLPEAKRERLAGSHEVARHRLAELSDDRPGTGGYDCGRHPAGGVWLFSLGAR
jgi:hypothetical protein